MGLKQVQHPKMFDFKNSNSYSALWTFVAHGLYSTLILGEFSTTSETLDKGYWNAEVEKQSRVTGMCYQVWSSIGKGSVTFLHKF